jgi:RNA:NAD 2'-phosphotransferase (TPT1/KptA family)
MAVAGHVFHLTSNQVWLTDRVPPEFLTVLDIAGTGGAGGS